MRNLIVGNGLIPNAFNDEDLTQEILNILKAESGMYNELERTITNLRNFYNINRELIKGEFPFSSDEFIQGLLQEVSAAKSFAMDDAEEVQDKLIVQELSENINPQTGMMSDLFPQGDENMEEDVFQDITEEIVTAPERRIASIENILRGRGLRNPNVSISQVTGGMIATLNQEKQLLMEAYNASSNLVGLYQQYNTIINVPESIFGQGLISLISLRKTFKDMADNLENSINFLSFAMEQQQINV